MSSRTFKAKKAKAKVTRRERPREERRREERAAAAPGPAEEMLFGTELEEL